MTRSVVPLNQIDRRLAEAGRIRMGHMVSGVSKAGKKYTRPDHLTNFRFTSPTRELIEQIAALYGGQVTEWVEPKASPSHQWQVTVEMDRINIILPPDCFSQNYELWSGGGAQRRCNGEMCEVALKKGPDGDWEMDTVPCICQATGAMECQPHTRLTVILPGVDMRGSWRLETKGWNALHELPGMVDFIQGLAEQGRVVMAQLSIAKVEKNVSGRKSHYVVPKIELPYTPEQIVSGAATLTALEGEASVNPDLPALPPGGQSGGEDDDVVDAELVSELELEVIDCANQYGQDPQRLWRALVAKTEGDEDRIRVAVAKMKSGALEPDGFDAQGSVIWVTR